MKSLCLFILLTGMALGLLAQDITISFQPKAGGTTIDSTWVTNLTKNQKVKLLGNESLILTKTTGIDFVSSFSQNGNLYPNPCFGETSLHFFTYINQEVELHVYNISGQLISQKKEKLVPGQHRFQIGLPVTGMYIVSLALNEGPLSFKTVNLGNKQNECFIEYGGNETQKQIKNALSGKTLNYTDGDIMHYSAFSGKNNTIITDSPKETKAYNVEFIECKDGENQNYAVVKIGDQWWMAKNLQTKKTRDASLIQQITNAGTWANNKGLAYCWYNNDSSAYKNRYGALYSLENSSSACPAGWHLPGNSEWRSLSSFLGGNKISGGKMKETGTSQWMSPNDNATNESGFSGLPGGIRTQGGSFNGVGSFGAWWSSTDSSDVTFFYSLSRDQGNALIESKDEGFGRYGGRSIRCVRDKSEFSQDISSVGGEIVVSGASDSINGISISIPPNSFSRTHNFKIYAEPVPAGVIPDAAKPVSHMICINTDIGYSDSLITISVPVNLPPNSSPMAFFFNPETNDLEAIPTINAGENNIQFVLRRFSSLTSSKSASAFETIKLLILDFDFEKITNIDTGFKPSVDGWEFINYGAYYIPPGSCEGMSLTAKWYYTEKRIKQKQPSLYGLFDKQNNEDYEQRNAPYLNGLFDNLKIEFDNPLGFRYTSFIQGKCLDIKKFINSEDVKNFMYIVKAIYTENQPVLINAFKSTETGGLSKGHALVAYRYDWLAGKIFVYDPKRPHNDSKSIELDGLTFKPYPIADGKPDSFDKFFYIDKSYYFDYALLDYYWATKEFQMKSVFPDYSLSYEYHNAPELITEDIVPICSKTVEISLNPTNLACLVFNPEGVPVFTPKSVGPLVPPSSTLECKSSLSTFGFCILGINSEYYTEHPLEAGEKPDYCYIDFKWVTFKQEQNSIEIVSGINQSGTYGKQLPETLKIIVKDILKNPVEGAMVYFKAKNNGSVSPAEVQTLKDGTASVKWTLGPTDSTQTVEVTAFKSDKTPLEGSPVTFTAKATGPTGTFTDGRDGRIYKWVKINSQVWMAENMAYLPSVYPPSDGSHTEPRYYVYDYQGTDVALAKLQTSFKTYGVLYNWPAALITCPAGWHLPSKDEWATLINYLGGINTAGVEMKATSGWYGNGNGNNSSGFSGLPGGGRFANWVFGGITGDGHWWESTVIDPVFGDDPRAWYHHLYDNLPGVHRDNYYRQGGFSVRCVKD